METEKWIEELTEKKIAKKLGGCNYEEFESLKFTREQHIEYKLKMDELKKQREKLVEERNTDLVNLNISQSENNKEYIEIYEKLVDDETTNINEIDEKLGIYERWLENTQSKLKEKEKKYGMNIKE